jgi:acetyl esterase
MDPTTRAFLDDLIASGIPPLEQQTVAEARDGAKALQAGPVPLRPADVADHTLPIGHNGKVRVRIVRPSNSRSQLPVVMFFHGGGWVLNDADSYRYLLHEIAVGAGVALVFVEYTLSPEARYPIALKECYAVTKWIADNGRELNLDGSRLAVMGDSAGGNLTAAVTLLATERGGPNIAHQLLLYPVTDANFNTPSYQEFAAGPFLTRPAMQWFWDHYLPDVTKRTEPTASPLRAPRDRLAKLPPALLLTAELDSLRDEGEQYARRLVDAGVSCTHVRCLGTIHGFISLNALIDTPAARMARDQIIQTLRTALT